MATKADRGADREFKVVPSGTHVARCYGFYHIGHVPNTFPGAKSAVQNKIRVVWELPEELMDPSDEKSKPFSIAQEYTLSMNPKANLRKVVESWLGRKMEDEEANDFDAETLVGMDCLLTVAHIESKGRTFARVQTITKLPAKMKCPPMSNPQQIVTWPTMTREAFDALPQFLRDKMVQSTEYASFAKDQGIETVPF